MAYLFIRPSKLHLLVESTLDKDRVLELIRRNGLEAKLNDDGSADIRTFLGMDFRIMDAWDKVLSEVVSISSFVDYVSATAQRIDDEYRSSLN